MSKCAYNTKEQIQDVIKNLKEKNIPIETINIDGGWFTENYYQTIGTDACDFNWNVKNMGSRKELVTYMKENGYRMCMWINPYIAEGIPMYEEASKRGYLVRDINGGFARIESGEPAGLVDFTNEAAVNWWKNYLYELLEDGVECLKADYSERVPETALFLNGKTGKEMHNIYPHLYVKVVDEATYKYKKEHIVFRRSGYIGTQKYAVTWSGDCQTTWSSLKCVIRAGLSAGLTGEAFWSHDIGGFTGPKPTDELYVR